MSSTGVPSIGWKLLSPTARQPPTFGLPVRAQAVFDARNLLDFQARTNNGEMLLKVGSTGRSVRGGISVRF